MKKVGARILLCLMLVIALVTSTLTAFAEPNTTETPATEQPTSDSNKLDLSRFKSGDLKDFGGIASDGCVYLKSGYSYLFLFEKDGKYYIESWETLVQVEDVNKYVTTESNYRSDYPVASDKYYYIDSLESMKKNVFADNHFYILALTGKEYINVGKFNDVTELKNGNVVEKDAIFNPSTEITEGVVFDVSESHSSDSATITVKYKADGAGTPFLSIDLFLNGGIVTSKDLDTSKLEGEQSFTVDTNGSYEVYLYKTSQASQKSIYLSKSIKIEGLNERKQTAPQQIVDMSTSKAYKKPVITFKNKPKSASDGSTVTLTMKSSTKAVLNFNGKSSKEYVNSMKVNVSTNGTYTYRALGKGGKEVKGTLKVNFFKKPRAFKDEDRDNFWNNPNSPISAITSKLPQTGSVGWYWMIAFGVALIGVGGFVVFKATKSRKNKGIENK